MPKRDVDPEFPCSLIISTPFPSHRLASSALRSLQVDAELSPLVRRSFTLIPSPPSSPSSVSSGGSTTGGLPTGGADGQAQSAGDQIDEDAKTVLRTEYKAKTNRMLRVAVNGFMESLGVVLGVMERLDVDVVNKA